MAEDKKTAKKDEKAVKKETKKEKKPEKKISPDEKYKELKPGLIVQVHQLITEKNPKGEEKQRIQVFEGQIIARKHGKGINSTITVRKSSSGIGVEKIFPLHLPTITDIKPVRKYKTRQSKLYYLRNSKKRLKEDKEYLKTK